MFNFVSILDFFHIVAANGQLESCLSGVHVGSRRKLGNLGFNERTLLEDEIRKPRATEPVSKLGYREAGLGFIYNSGTEKFKRSHGGLISPDSGGDFNPNTILERLPFCPRLRNL